MWDIIETSQPMFDSVKVLDEVVSVCLLIQELWGNSETNEQVIISRSIIKEFENEA